MSRTALKCLDRAFSLLVVCPLVVLYWRGVWSLTDKFVLPHCRLLSGWVTWAAGFTVVFLLTAVQGATKNLAARQPGYVQIITRIQQALCGVASVFAWRGFWLIEDVYLGISLGSSTITFAVPLIMLLLLRSLRNAAESSPLVLIIDDASDCLDIPTRFQTKVRDSKTRYLADCFISVFVIGTLNISVWRGLWSFLDQVILPIDLLSSAVVSLAIGCVLTLSMFIAEPVLIRVHNIFRAWSSRRRKLWLLMLEDVWSFFGTLAVVTTWRAVWMVADIYLGLDVPWTFGSTVASAWLLSVLCCSCTIPGVGTITDGQPPERGGPALPFRIAYFTAITREGEVVQQLDAEAPMIN
ncbi:uncharacterized protein LOC135396967 [Ornithodoros turicata]|uniref:uncharacterized protein LOC135396967 n=1 Tax=Ornithodoros turicata TaxID=34597 RepID=UPI00313A4910